jgi:hypothetical protein
LSASSVCKAEGFCRHGFRADVLVSAPIESAAAPAVARSRWTAAAAAAAAATRTAPELGSQGLSPSALSHVCDATASTVVALLVVGRGVVMSAK